MLKIQTHYPTSKTLKEKFYMLSKGLNAGRPMENPCPNCFVVSTDTAEEKEFYFWLSYGLWQSGSFREYLVGSVIPFIRIGDARKLLRESADKARAKNGKFEKAIEGLKKMEAHQAIILEQLRLIKEVKRAVMMEVLRE